MVQFRTPDGQPMKQPQAPPRFHPTVEDAERAIQRGGFVNLHSLTAFMVTEGTTATGGRPQYRGIVFSREGKWESMQWNGILRGAWDTRDEAIQALLHPVNRQ